MCNTAISFWTLNAYVHNTLLSPHPSSTERANLKGHEIYNFDKPFHCLSLLHTLIDRLSDLYQKNIEAFFKKKQIMHYRYMTYIVQLSNPQDKKKW